MQCYGMFLLLSFPASRSSLLYQHADVWRLITHPSGLPGFYPMPAFLPLPPFTSECAGRNPALLYHRCYLLLIIYLVFFWGGEIFSKGEPETASVSANYTSLETKLCESISQYCSSRSKLKKTLSIKKKKKNHSSQILFFFVFLWLKQLHRRKSSLCFENLQPLLVALKAGHLSSAVSLGR